MNNKEYDPYLKWGEIKLEKLSKEIDTNRLRLPRPMIIDEPLFSSNLHTYSDQRTNCLEATRVRNKSLLTSNQIHVENSKKVGLVAEKPTLEDKQTQINLQPTIDSYIINTIKLNKILKSGLSFDQIEYFTNKKGRIQVNLQILWCKIIIIQIRQAFEELKIGSIEEIKNFYLNDIIHYHNETFKKVSKLYEQYKEKKLAEKLAKTEGELKVEEFIRENDFLNDESNSILGELLTDLNVTHFDEEMNKLLQIIGNDPFALMSEEFQQNIQKI